MWASAVFRCWLVGVGGLLLGSCAAGRAGDGRDVMLCETSDSVQQAPLISAGKSPVLDVPQALIQASPDHAKWEPVGSMNTTRVFHSSILLKDGNVWISGGVSCPVYPSACTANLVSEIFDPATGAFTERGQILTSRTGHVSMLLDDGRVLLIGGSAFTSNTFFPTAATEIVDPQTGQSVDSGSMFIERGTPAAARMLDGRILVVGGGTDIGEIFDPITGQWGIITMPMLASRHAPTATLLKDGTVLIAGGGTAEAELFDPKGDKWFAVPSMQVARDFHTATLLGSGEVLVTGGNHSKTAELFDPISQSWVFVGPMSEGRSAHQAVLLGDGEVLICGGDEYSFERAEIFEPASKSFVSTDRLGENLKSMGVTPLLNGLVLVSGGIFPYEANQYGSKDAYLFHPRGNRQWRRGPALPTQRSAHVSVTLPDGKILVAGGEGDSSTLVFDPDLETWASRASMNMERNGHQALLLRDGRVLVAGGELNPTAEVYDPKSDSWTMTGGMNQVRAGLSLTLLQDGTVLAVGGAGYDSSTERFDPVSMQWIPDTPMQFYRFGHSALGLSDGRVLVAGGWDDPYNHFGEPLGQPIEAEIYDPQSRTWSPAQGFPGTPRDMGAVLLGNGDALFVGGLLPCGNPCAGDNYSHKGVRMFQAATGLWKQPPDMPFLVHGTSATLLPSGKVLVAGGTRSLYFQPTVFLNESALFDPKSQAWTSVDGMNASHAHGTAAVLPNGTVMVPGGQTAAVDIYDPASIWNSAATMYSGRVHHSAVPLPDGRVMVVGGINGLNVLGDAEVYDPVANTWASLPSFGVPRANLTLTSLNGRIVAVGGISDAYPGGILPLVHAYDPGTQSVVPLTPLLQARGRHQALRLPNEMLLVAGGIGSSGPLSSVEIYNPFQNKWIQAAPMNSPRWEHSMTLLSDGRVLAAGGRSSGSAVQSAEIYDPQNDAWEEAGKMNNAHSNHSAVLLLDGRVLVAGGEGPGTLQAGAEIFDPSTKTWSVSTSMNIARSEAVAARLNNGKVIVAGGKGISGPLVSAEVFDPWAQSWVNVRSLVDARYGAEGVILKDGSLLVLGGVGGAGTPLAGVERYGLIDTGELCHHAADCQSGFCADNVCCNTACDAGPCDGCSVLSGAKTAGECTPLTGPQCNDGNACTQSDICQVGICVGGEPRQCKVPGICQQSGLCDPETGLCSDPINREDGSRCEDSDPCTMDESCLKGQCEMVDVLCDCGNCGFYRCKGREHRCLTACTSVEECAAGYVCNRHGQCVPPPPTHGKIENGSCELRALSSSEQGTGVASSGWLGLLIYQVIRRLSRHSRRFPQDFRPRTQCSMLSVEVSPVTCKNGSDF